MKEPGRNRPRKVNFQGTCTHWKVVIPLNALGGDDGVSDAALGAICEVIDHVADMHELSLRSVSKHVFRLSRVLVRGPYCAASNWFS